MVKPTKGIVENGNIALGFEMKLVTLSVDEILPVKMITPEIRRRQTYKRLPLSRKMIVTLQRLNIFLNPVNDNKR